jgi:hypothetical protein
MKSQNLTNNNLLFFLNIILLRVVFPGTYFREDIPVTNQINVCPIINIYKQIKG